MKWVVRVLIGLAALVVVLLAVVVGALLWFHIPQNASGMAAQTVCDAAFVSGRDQPADALMAAEVLPASPVLAVISTSIDHDQHTVTSRFLGLFPRTSALLSDRGCVLDGTPDPTARPYTPRALNPAPWPEGDAAVADPAAHGVDTAKLSGVLDAAMTGSGDVTAANARGIAVVQDGRLLAQRDGAGIAPNTALHGWSMTKTVAAMLFWKKAKEVGLDPATPVVQAFPAGRAPTWVAEWAKDERAKITVADLVFMRDGLNLTEGYGPTGDVVQMLYGEPDMSGWAASHGLKAAPGTQWEYLSATSNILAAVTRAQFATDDEYLAYARTALFDPMGLTTATLQPDASGTDVASSYLWASAGDWARLGQLMLRDGAWNGSQVLPAGWLAYAQTPAMPSGEGHAYGAQSWMPANAGGDCAATPGFPKDTVEMEGHWGQVVAMIPSKDAVIVRLGWTFEKSTWNSCQFVADVAAALPDSPK